MPIQLYRSGLFIGYDKQEGNPLNLVSGNKNKEGQGRVYPFGTKQKAIFISRCIYLSEIADWKPKTFILTYNSDYVQDTKSHINYFLTRLRRGDLCDREKPTKKKPVKYAYSLEFTDKGQFHYHFLVDHPFIDPVKASNIWSQARGYHSRNAVTGLDTLKDPVASAFYASKYFAKAKSGSQYLERGKSLRFWATSNNICGSETFTIPDKNPDGTRNEIGKIVQDNAIFTKEMDFYTKGFIKTREAIRIFQENYSF
mgnify:CR=1 FL=1